MNVIAREPGRHNRGTADVAEIWCRVLGCESTDPADNFFDVGGTSLAAIELVRELAEHLGVETDTQTIYAHPTLGGLVDALRPSVGWRGSETATAPASAGAWPLLPSQAWFFSKGFAFPEHWCVSANFAASEPLDCGRLSEAVALACDLHDGLRVQFRNNGGAWQQYEHAAGRADVSRHDLSALPASRQDEAIKAWGEQVSRSFVLGTGPLVKVAIIALGPERGTRLVVVAHHLVTDFVSLRILIEDIETAYAWLVPKTTGTQTTVPIARTTSPLTWAGQLNSVDSVQQAIRTVGLSARPTMAIPLDLDGPGAQGQQQVTGGVDAATTLALEQAALKHHRTSVETVLLAGFAHVIARWSETSAVTIGLMSHGRTPTPPGVNLSRTVGWLAGHAPLDVEAPSDASSSAAVGAVVDALQGWPRAFASHAALRLASMGGQAPVGLSPRMDPPVSFNYLGNVDSAYRDLALFRKGSEHTGVRYFQGNRAPRPLSLMCAIKNGALSTAWLFDPARLHRATVERLARSMESALASLAEESNVVAASCHD
jgi:non-ribosomal peptide synthase protein (TIGR01720 family)